MTGFRPPIRDLEASGFRRLRGSLLVDTLVYTAVRAGTAVASLLLLVVLSHALAPSDLGTFALVANAAGLVGIAWYGWLGSASYRFSPSYRAAGRLSEMRALAVRIYSALAVLLIVILLGLRFAGLGVAASFSVGLFSAALILTVSLGPAQSLVELYRVDGGRREYVTGALALGVGPLIVVLLATWATDVTVEVVLWAQAVFAGCIFAFVGVSWIGGRRTSRGEWIPTLRRFATYGFPFVGGLICGWILSVGDRYLIAALTDAHDVGTYTAGYQLAAAPLVFLYAAAVAPVEPLVFSAHEGDDPERAGAILGKTFVLFLACATLGLIVLTVLREELASRLLGVPYVESADVIPLAALGATLMSLALLRQQTLILMRRTGTTFLALLGAAGVNIGLNLLLIPHLGIVGAATASVGAYGFHLVATVVLSQGRYPFAPPRRWLVSWAAATLSSIVLVILIAAVLNGTTSRIVEAVTGTICYVAVLMKSSNGEFVGFVKSLRKPASGDG